MTGRKPKHDGKFDAEPNASSFEVLVGRARAGEQDALCELIENYRNYLLFIANDHVDQALQAKVGASDAVQESIMHAQLNFDQFAGNSERDLKAWLTTIVTNDVRKNRRKFRAQKRDAKMEVNIQEQSAVGRSLLDEQLTPSSEAIKQEKAHALSKAMSRLPEDQQKVIQFRNFDRLDFTEIGDRMDRSADAARKLWARAIESLKLALKSVSPELIDLIETTGDRENQNE